MQNSETGGGRLSGRAGGAGVAVLLLLVVAGAVAAWWFLFRLSGEVRLPAEQDTGGASASSAAKSGANANVTVAADAVADYAGDTTSVPVSSSGNPLPVTASGMVDWDARHAQLKKQYLKEFNEPKIGTDIKLMLNSGTVVQGRISDLTKDQIQLRVGSGHATYKREQVSPRSQVAIFRDVFSDHVSQKTLSEEKAALAAAMHQ